MAISCEGVEKGIRNTMKFESKGAKLDYIERFCLKYPNNCYICEAAERKYN
jgi:hypothetical protein